MKKIYLICPVRNVDPNIVDFLEEYVQEQEELHGNKVHYPPRDVDQSDPNGKEICHAHMMAMLTADEVHLYWDPKSTGSKFDFGMAYMRAHSVCKCSPLKFVIINPEDVRPTPHKSFENVLLSLVEDA